MQLGDPPLAGRLQASLGVVASTGALGSLLLALSAWSAGVFPLRSRPASWTAWTPFVLPVWVGWVAWFAGLALLATAWIGLHRLARSGELRLGRAVAVAVLWAVPLLIAPPLGSRDVYSYAAHGELASRGEDPGQAPPSALGSLSPYLQDVDPTWRGVVSAYGPAATGTARLAVAVAGHDVTATVFAMRAWMVGGVALLGLGVVALARQEGTDGVDAFVLAVAGPLTLVHLVAGVHNEALMAGLMVCGLALAARRPGPGGAIGGTVLVALGAAVKVPAVLAVVYLGWRYDGRPAPTWLRAARTAGLLGVAAVTMQAVHVVTGLSWGWLGGLTAGANVTTVLSVSTTLGLLARWLFVPLGIDKDATVRAVRDAAQLAGFAIASVLLWRTPRLGLAGLGGALLVLAVAGASLHPWYFVWALPVLAVVVAGGRAIAFVAVSIGVAASARPEGGGLLSNLGFYPAVVLPLAFLAGGALWWWFSPGSAQRRSAAPLAVRTPASS